MIVQVERFLSPPELDRLGRLFDTAVQRDGGESAGVRLAGHKRNRELDLGEDGPAVREIVLAACARCPELAFVVLPKLVTRPILSVYETGMFYGPHMDSAFGQENGTVYRTDFSCTVFLSEPGSYDGGELVIETEDDRCRVKLPAGGAVFYPTLYDHQVTPVTRGARRACVFWVESMVRDPQKRRILLDVAQVAEWIAAREGLDSPPRRAIVRARENLLRMWLDA